jgi:hypothetical protein
MDRNEGACAQERKALQTIPRELCEMSGSCRYLEHVSVDEPGVWIVLKVCTT